MSLRRRMHVGSSSSSGTGYYGGPRLVNMEVVDQWVSNLHDYGTREQALYLLTEDMQVCIAAAPTLLRSVISLAAVLQEIVDVYHSIYSPFLTDRSSRRACNAICLLQGLATHSETRMHMIKAHLPMYVYPFLNMMYIGHHHEQLRLASLGLLCALVTFDDTRVTHFLLYSQVFPCLLHTLESGTEMAKSLAMHTINRMLTNDETLNYCSVLAERFFTIGRILKDLLDKLIDDGRLAEEIPKQMLKHIIWCYFRLSDNPRVCDGLRCILPRRLKESAVINVIHGDETAMQCLRHLFHNITTRHAYKAQPIGPPRGRYTRR